MNPAPKREVPLNLLRAIENLKNRDLGGYTRTKSSNSYLLVKDPHPDSSFFFSVIEVLIQNHGIEYRYVQKPASEGDPSSVQSAMAENGFDIQYSYWQKLVEAYASVPDNYAFDPDPIFEQYQQEELANFQLLDEDADTHSFSEPIQLYIDGYLGKVVKRLEYYKESSDLDEERIEEVNETIEEIRILKANQTRLPKQQVVKGLAKIWARVRKLGVNILDEVKKEMIKEGIKFITKQMIENPEAIGNTINGLLDKF